MSDTVLKKNYGLIPRPLPKRRLKTHQLFGTASPADIPDTFDVGDVIGPVDQGATPFCTCYTTRELVSDIDKIAYDENWNVAMTGKVTGSPILTGASAQDAMEAMIAYGPLLQTDTPPDMTWQQKGMDFIADPANWTPDLFLKAAPHERVAALTIDGPYDAFDNLRSQMWMHKRSAGLATKWYFGTFNTPDGNGIVATLTDQNNPNFSYHMYTAKRLDVVNGQQVVWMKPYEGGSYGKNGMIAFDRQTINNLYGPTAFGSAHIFVDAISLLGRLQQEQQIVLQFFEEMLARFLQRKQ